MVGFFIIYKASSYKKYLRSQITTYIFVVK